MIAVRLIDGTVAMSRNFRVTKSHIWMDDIKYADGNEVPAYMAGSMSFSIGAVETYAIVHKKIEEEDDGEVPED
jgi:hypothetical protein